VKALTLSFESLSRWRQWTATTTEGLRYETNMHAYAKQELSSIWDGRRFGHNKHGPKSRGCCAPFVGELGPHLTQCGLGQGLHSYQVASWSIQPFGYNTATLQTGQTRQRSHSIGRTVTCNVSPKSPQIASHLNLPHGTTITKNNEENWKKHTTHKIASLSKSLCKGSSEGN